MLSHINVVVLKYKCTSRSPRELVKIQILGSISNIPDSVALGCNLRIFILNKFPSYEKAHGPYLKNQ